MVCRLDLLWLSLSMMKKRPKPVKKPKAKGKKLTNAWASAKKARVAPDRTLEWMKDDFIPMRHMPSGRALKNLCTCKVAPTKWCWVCRKYAIPPVQIQPHEDPRGQGEVDLWSDWKDYQ